MKLPTSIRIWRRIGEINHQVENHERVLNEILDRQLEMVEVITANSQLSKNIAEFSVDMAGLLVDLMADVHDIAEIHGQTAIAERIDARADIAGAMLALRNEANK